MPDDVASTITSALARVGDGVAYTVRSSATAEDLPAASFAGQHDTYLNVTGTGAVLDRVRACWASLFTDHAVIYRLRNGVDHRTVRMAVVIQRLVEPDASGVLFTADPATSNRTMTTVEATLGLGEALVSGRVKTDAYRVHDDQIVERSIAAKRLAVHASRSGGTHEAPVDPERQTRAALTDTQVLALARLGRHIESHFGVPQDIEWCLADDVFQIVQTRPITALFPIPPAADDNNHVYVSVGHAQMMTDPMRPLGLSMWQLTTPAPMAEAAGRLFVDVTTPLASPAGRDGLLEVLGHGDPLTRDALETVIDRGGFLPPPAEPARVPPRHGGSPVEPIDPDPSIVTELIDHNRASVAKLRRDIGSKSGTDLFDFILDDLQTLRGLLFDPRSNQVFMTAMQATWWINDHVSEWLGDRNAADALTQSAPNNVSSEMGLALLDVADVIRPHPDVVTYLEHVGADDGFLDRLDELDGGSAARDAIAAYLDEYGMRCVGEIDITRPRWSERPSALVPALIHNVRHFEPGAASRRFEQGRSEAATAEHDLLERLRALPDGNQRAADTKREVDRLRTFIGYREYPKYGMICRYFLYKQALLREADRLTAAGALDEPHDIYYLRFDELRDAVDTDHVDRDLIAERKSAFISFGALTPPRVLTSDGEAVSGSYRRDDLPPGALIGLAVSAGTVEGRARIVSDMADADLEPGDILVTAHTDPSWSPLFVSIAGLVTEVGGLLTHGAVVAREYGLPAVVGVDHATQRIEDGQRIRVNGTDGSIELLPTPS